MKEDFQITGSVALCAGDDIPISLSIAKNNKVKEEGCWAWLGRKKKNPDCLAEKNFN